MLAFRWLSELKVLLLGTTTTITNTESRQSRENVEEKLYERHRQWKRGKGSRRGGWKLLLLLILLLFLFLLQTVRRRRKFLGDIELGR